MTTPAGRPGRRSPSPVWRIAAIVVLVGLAALWFVLDGAGNAAAAPVLVIALAFSLTCAYLNLTGRL